MRYQVAADYLPKLASLRDRLTETLSSIDGASVEDNVFSVSVHYRNCHPNDVERVSHSLLVHFLSFPHGTGAILHTSRVVAYRHQFFGTYIYKQVYDVVQTIKGDYPSIRFGTGKCVFELRPDITWDKGKAMVWLLQALGLQEKDDVFTIYIGDDMTDEDAFQVR